MTIKIRVQIFCSAAALLLLPTVGQAATYTDSAANYPLDYDGQGVFTPGYGQFSLITVNGNNTAPYSGTFTGDASGSEGGNGSTAPSTINTNGVAFGFYAYGSSDASVTIDRTFLQGPQATGDSFSLDFVPGYNDLGTVGVSLLTDNGAVGSLEFQSGGAGYSFNGAATGQGFSAGAMHLSWMLTSPTTYSFLSTGAVSYSGAGALTAPITGFEVTQTNSGGTGDDAHNGFFNNLSLTTNTPVPETPADISLGLLLSLGLGGIVAVRKGAAASAK